MLCVVGLAQRLLEADLPDPAPASVSPLPYWLIPTILWRWGSPRSMPFRYYLRRPRELPAAVLHRWLSPMRATLRLGLGARHSLLLIQSLSLLVRPVEMAVRLRRGLRKRLGRRKRDLLPVHEERVF
jgi:hypothetical protein